MRVDDLLNWPVPADPAEAEEATEEGARTLARLRAELADANAELRRLRARLEHLEEENARLTRQLKGPPR